MTSLSALKHRWYKRCFTVAKQQAFLTELANLLEDDITPLNAINIMRGSASQNMLTILFTIQNQLQVACSLADALAHWFSPTILEIIRAGEKHQRLPAALRAAARSLREHAKMTRTLLSNIFYPLLVVTVSLILLITLHRTILNQLLAIMPLQYWPSHSRLLVSLAHGVEIWWPSVVMTLLIFGFLLGKLLQDYIGSARKFIDSAPLLNLYRRFSAVRFMRLVGMMTSNGIAFNHALKILQHHAEPYLCWHLLNMEHHLVAGKEHITEVLDTGLLQTSDLQRLHAISDNKGLSHALLRHSDRVENECRERLQQVSKTSALTLLLLAAALGFFMVYGIYNAGVFISG